MHKVKHCHTDSVHFHNPTLCTQQFPLGVQKKIRANQLQRIGLHIKACLAAARSADYDNVEIMFMRVAVGAEAYILGQNVIFFGVFGIAVLDCLVCGRCPTWPYHVPRRGGGLLGRAYSSRRPTDKAPAPPAEILECWRTSAAWMGCAEFRTTLR